MHTPDTTPCAHCPDRICKPVPGNPNVKVVIYVGGTDPGVPETHAGSIKQCPGPETRPLGEFKPVLAVTD